MVLRTGATNRHTKLWKARKILVRRLYYVGPVLVVGSTLCVRRAPYFSTPPSNSTGLHNRRLRVLIRLSFCKIIVKSSFFFAMCWARPSCCVLASIAAFCVRACCVLCRTSPTAVLLRVVLFSVQCIFFVFTFRETPHIHLSASHMSTALMFYVRKAPPGALVHPPTLVPCRSCRWHRSALDVPALSS